VAALGGAGYLVGISHECDYPVSVQHLPRVTSTPLDVDAPGAILDAEVCRLRDAGQAVIGIEAELLRRLQPDLIVTQSLCDVCAVSGGAVHRLAEALSPAPGVLTLEGRDLAGIWADIRRVGSALQLADEAEERAAIPATASGRTFGTSGRTTYSSCCVALESLAPGASSTRCGMPRPWPF
jgi:iron complex transport system substrate-binding protein